MDTIHTITNGHTRPVLDAWDTTAEERARLDYVDWDAVERGEDSFSGVRYRGWLYDLSEFERVTGGLSAWDGVQTDSYFSAVALRFDRDDPDLVVMARLHW